VAQEILGSHLLTVHNLYFYQQLMTRIRKAIAEGAEALLALRIEVMQWNQSV
jgi:tRNA-guanine family transglycosylase